jgi:cytochrome c-type biogenesis protein CcmH
MSRVGRRLAVLFTVMLALSGAGAACAHAAQHLNAYSLQGDFICVSCHEPLNQVNSPESQAEKQTLTQLVNQGLDYSQIKTQMVDDYTAAVLAEPPAHGLNLLVYILPPLFLVGGLGFLGYNVPRWRQRARAAAQLASTPEMPLDPADEQRLNAELETFDG